MRSHRAPGGRGELRLGPGHSLDVPSTAGDGCPWWRTTIRSWDRFRSPRKLPQSGRPPCDRQRFGHRPGGQCLNYFAVWDPDHRIEVAPGQFQALFADLFDNEVKTTAYAISDYRTIPDLATRLRKAFGTVPPAALSARGLLGGILARRRRRSASRNDSGADTRNG